jgi:hypothetical protein
MATKNLKKVICVATIVVAVLCYAKNASAQCYYHDESNPPEELFRKRVKEDGMRYGNPYTMFVRDDNFSLNTSLAQIRINLKSKTPPTGSNDFPIYSYADLYKGIYKPTIRSLRQAIAEGTTDFK